MPARTHIFFRSRLFAARSLLVLGCGTAMLGGCAAINIQTYSGAKQPTNQVARLRPLSAQILSVDGAPVKEQCGGRLMRKCYVFFLPGLHSVKIQPISLEGGGGLGYIPPTVATPGMFITDPYYYQNVGSPIKVKYMFLAGHDYSFLSAGICLIRPATANRPAIREPARAGRCLHDQTTGLEIHAE